jgi:hypothetical protein
MALLLPGAHVHSLLVAVCSCPSIEFARNSLLSVLQNFFEIASHYEHYC